MSLLTTPRLPKALSQELRAAGFEPSKVLRALPEWCLNVVKDPSGLTEVKGFLAKHFGLEIGPDGKLRQRLMPPACFKTQAGTSITTIAPVRALLTSLANQIASVTTTTYNPSFFVGDVRRRILDETQAPWLGLEQIVSACWANGVPVMHLPQLPINNPKLVGMVTMSNDRPVITITTKKKPAWLLFDIAHEIGHIGMGHLDRENTSIFDETIHNECEPGKSDSDTDYQEDEANQYAIKLLSDGLSYIFSTPRKPALFARMAEKIGLEHQVDPGHIILNAVKHSKLNGATPWALGQAALNELGGQVSLSFFSTIMNQHIDVSKLSDDGFELLERLGTI